jgi:hypothetical protein
MVGTWLLFLGMASAPAHAETFDFESAAYVHGRTLDGADGWSLSASLGGISSSFVAYAETVEVTGHRNTWMRVATAGTGALYRYVSTQSGILDLRWRWRASDSRADACLGASGGLESARNAVRSLACFHAGGNVSVVEGTRSNEVAANATWSPGLVYYMRMRIDVAENAYTLYMSTDSLRAAETAVTGAVKMAGIPSDPLTRVVVQAEAGLGTMDVDDIVWEPMAVWTGLAPDSLASNPANWSTGAVPGSQTWIVFGADHDRGCLVDKNLAVRGITVEEGYAGTLDLGNSVLAVSGNADFTGLAKSATGGAGYIRLTAPRAQSLTGPEAGHMPPVLHDGAGVLRLDGRALFARDLGHVAGVLDLNGFDIVLEGRFQILGGGPGSVRNLDGRSISGRWARLEGTAGSPLALRGTLKQWNLSFSDSLSARHAQIERSSAGSARGIAVSSTDLGGNLNWTFAVPPAIALEPVPATVLVGHSATLKVRATGTAPLSYQWTRGGKPVPGATDSTLYKAGTVLADSGIYACVVSNAAGSDTSLSVRLAVSFPAPTIDPEPHAFSDSVRVRITPPVAAAKVHASINGAPYAVVADDLVLRESAVIKAHAVLGSDTGAAVTWNFPKSQVAQVQQPAILPETGSFSDSVSVSIATPTDGAAIHYTLDGSKPDASGKLYDGPFTLRATTVVSAVAIKEGMQNSEVETRVFTRITTDTLAMPKAVPPGGFFADTVTVTLLPPEPGATLYYTLDGGNLKPYEGPLVIREPSTLRAFAILGSVISDTASWTFSRRVEPPAILPSGRKFPDTVRISLTSRIPGAAIHFTLDGREPDSASPRYSVPFLLDSSATLKAVAAVPGLALSSTVTADYELVPDSLSASPRGGDYPAGLFIQLHCTSRRVRILYTLDGTAPGPENPASIPYAGGIPLDTNATLRAVAVAGHGSSLRVGREIRETYTFIHAGTKILGPGQKAEISSRYSLENPFPGAPPVEMAIMKPDSLKGLSGFRDVQFGLRVSLPEGTVAFPEVRLLAPAGEERTLYRVSPGGAIHYVSDDDTVPLPATGTYFLGVDTLPPRIVVNGESFVGDTTRLVITVQDNVSGALMDLERSDDPDRNLGSREIRDDEEILVLYLKAPGTEMAPLWIRMRVDDRRNLARLPADPSAVYQVSQKIQAIRTPPVLKIGSHAEAPWDLVSIPLELPGPITLGRLKDRNSARDLAGSAYDPADARNVALEDDSPLEPGRAVWLGSPSSLASLALPPIQTVARQGKETWQIRLRKGWNAIGNPSLRVLHWPHARGAAEYVNSQIKGLHGYDPELPGTGYFETDSLVPWKGYFVHYHGEKDTSVTLLATPYHPPAPAHAPAARRAGAQGRLAIALGLDRLPALRLGALPGARDGIGVEDEGQPPSPSRGASAGGLWSLRSRVRLGADYLEWKPGAVSSWRVVAAAPLQAGPGNTRVSPAPGAARIDGLSLPEGYAAYAVSSSRGLKFPLAEGGRIPLLPGSPDTLEIHAGPAEAVAAKLAAIPSTVESFAVSAAALDGGFALRLSLPHAARIRWTLWTLDGRAAAREDRDLAAGHYRLGLPGSRGRLEAGMYVLSLEWAGEGKAGRFTRKLALH